MKHIRISVLLASVLAGITMIGYAPKMNASAAFPGTDGSGADVASIGTYSASSSLMANGTSLSCVSTAHGSAALVRRIEVTQELQRLNTSGNWSVVASWHQVFYQFYCAMSNSKSALGSGTYRLKSTFTVYTDGESETLTVYSNIRSL